LVQESRKKETGKKKSEGVPSFTILKTGKNKGERKEKGVPYKKTEGIHGEGGGKGEGKPAR